MAVPLVPGPGLGDANAAQKSMSTLLKNQCDFCAVLIEPKQSGPAGTARGASGAAPRRARAACRACPRPSPAARPGPAASARGTTGPVWSGSSARLVRLALPSHPACMRLACPPGAIPGPPATRPSRPSHHGAETACRLRICHILPCFRPPGRGASGVRAGVSRPMRAREATPTHLSA